MAKNRWKWARRVIAICTLAGFAVGVAYNQPLVASTDAGTKLTATALTTFCIYVGTPAGLTACAPAPADANSDKTKTATAAAVQAAPVQKATPPSAAIVAVTTSQPVVTEVVEWDEYTARFDAMEAVEVRARISGYLTAIAFKDGQMVKKGELLYEIDPRPFERALDQARAEVAQAKTKADNSMLDVERGRPLMERKVLSDKAFDDRANILRDAQASVKVAEAKVATAELDVAFTRITSPINGRIGRALVTAGNWVSAGAAANATLLTTIVSVDPIFIYFDVSENNNLKYKRLTDRGEKAGAAMTGATIEIAMPDETTFPYKGTLDFIDNRLDPGTATLRVRAKVDNKSGLFTPGMFARVRLAGSAKYQATLVPDEAVISDQANKFVLVVGEDGTANRRNIKPGPLHGGLRIIREGVKADDWVVVKGARARAGQKVDAKREPIKLKEATQAAAPAATPQPARN